MKSKKPDPTPQNTQLLYLTRNGKIEGVGPRKIGMKQFMACTVGNGTTAMHAPVHEFLTYSL
jgi:hypothetical protein